MPYVKFRTNTYGTASRAARKLRTNRTARTKSVVAKRRTNKPVARIQRTSYAPQRVKNTASIVQLAKQVRSLQLSQIGSIQQSIDHYTETLAVGTGSLTTMNPWAFCVNDFLLTATNGCPIFANGGSATGTGAGEYQRGYWSVVDTNASGSEKWDMWQDSQNDACSLTQYMPLSSKIMFEFTIQMLASTIPIWIRIDFVKMKNTHTTSTEHQWNLPKCIPGFGNLASEHLNVRNAINPSIFTRARKTRWIKLSPSDTTSVVTRRITENIQFSGKILKPDIADHATSGETFYSNVPLKDQLWCIISSSTTTGQGWPQGCHVEMRRHNKFRDPHGVSTP